MALHRFECVDVSLVFTKFCFNFKKSSIYLQVIFLLWGRKLFHFFSSECLGQGFLVFLPGRLFQISATAMHPLRSSKCSSNTEKKTQTKNQINKQKKPNTTSYIYLSTCVYTCILCTYWIYLHKNEREIVLCSESVAPNGMNWLILDHFYDFI